MSEPMTMGENIIERVADAIGKASENEYAGTLDIARAAIAALRDPSDAMMQIGGRIVAGLSSGRAIKPYEDDAAEAWQAMIDTALTEGTEHAQG